LNHHWNDLEETMREGRQSIIGLLFGKQSINYLGLAVLLAIVIFFSNSPGVFSGDLFRLSTAFWFWLSIGVVIFHQFFAWFVWRTELHLGLWKRWFGKNSFVVWVIPFAGLLACRILLEFILGFSNRGTWGISPALAWGLSIVILIPAIYTFYSIKKYFSFTRAAGADHFDPAYRKLGLVRQGIYRYTPNAMYIFAASIVWIPALVFGSKAALLSAFFNHAYLWVHFYTLEQPDMKLIYSTADN
jgi:hypothetical protein